MKRRIVSFVLALMLLVTMFPSAALAQESELPEEFAAAETGVTTLEDDADGEEEIELLAAVSGSCGDYAWWQLNRSTGYLEISGSGYVDTTPWNAYQNEIYKVKIGDNITGICAHAFNSYSELRTVEIGKGLSNIGEHAFYNCTALTGVYITDLAAWCAIDCFDTTNNPLFHAENLYLNGAFVRELVIPEGITEIKNYAFVNLSANSVEIPSTVKRIGWHAFESASLYELIINPGLTEVDNGAFFTCLNLKRVYYYDRGGNWDSVDIRENNGMLESATWHYMLLEYVFDFPTTGKNTHTVKKKCSQCSETLTGSKEECTTDGPRGSCHKCCSGFCGSSVQWVFDHENGVLTIFGEGRMKDCVDGAPWDAYASNIRTVVLEDGVTSIGEYAFSKLSYLKHLSISDDLDEIGWNAFSKSDMDVYYYGAKEQWNKADLKESLPDATIHYMQSGGGYIPRGDDTHYVLDTCVDCDVVRRGRTEACTDGNGDGACDKCSSGFCGKSVTWKFEKGTGQLTISGTGAMSQYDAAEAVPWYAYRSDIKLVVIDPGVTSIGSYAFYGCENLEAVVMQDSVTSVGAFAFDRDGCPALEDFYYYGTIEQWRKISESGNNLGMIYSRHLMTVNYIREKGKQHSAEHVCTDCGKIRERQPKESCVDLDSNDVCDQCANILSSDVMWAYDEKTNTLTLTGTGPVDKAPWCEKYQDSIQTVIINDGVTSIGNSAFYNCGSLTSVEIPTSVTSIGDSAFYNCDSLTSVEIPAGVTSIDESAFDSCGGLNSVHITDLAAWCQIDFENISSNPLCGSYGADLYLNDVLVKELAIPDGVTSIKQYTFCYCDSLDTVEIPDSVTTIGKGAFQSCGSLTSVKVPDSITSIGDDAFLICSELASVYITDLAAWCQIDFEDAGSNPLYAGESVSLYLNDTLVKELVIPDSVTSIGDYAFFRYRSLTSVEIPNSVTSIGASAFNGCAGLKTIKLADSVTNIEYWAFDYCYGLKEVFYYGTQTQWENIAVDSGNESLLYATLHTMPLSYTNNGDGTHTFEIVCTHCGMEETKGPTEACADLDKDEACDRCGSFVCGHKTVTGTYSKSSGRNHKVKETCDTCKQFLKEYTQACSDLTGDSCCDSCGTLMVLTGSCGEQVKWSFDYSVGALTITGTGAMSNYNAGKAPWYSYRSEIKTITVSSGVTGVGENAFYGCSALTKLALADSVTTMGKAAFSGCSRLSGVYITDLSAWCRIAFGNGSANPLYYAKKLYVSDVLLENLEVPNGVESIGSYAFYKCSTLKTVILPDTVKTIGTEAFSNSGLKEVYYYGTQEQWNGISIGSNNSMLTGATRHYMSAGYACGDGTHALADVCSHCDATRNVQTAEKCVDGDGNWHCDVCNWKFPCDHGSTVTEHISNRNETHRKQTLCTACKDALEVIEAQACTDADGNGGCDLCGGTMLGKTICVTMQDNPAGQVFAVIYDANGKFLTAETKTVAANAGQVQITFEDFAAENAAKIKLFLVDGAEEMKPLIESMLLVEK